MDLGHGCMVGVPLQVFVGRDGHVHESDPSQLGVMSIYICSLALHTRIHKETGTTEIVTIIGGSG
jgi:hypothetical protein